MVKLAMANSNTNTPTFSIPQSDYICAKKLVAEVAETLSVPSAANHVLIIGMDANGVNVGVYIMIDGVATIPGNDITDGTASEICPAIRSVATASIIGVIAPVDCIVTFAFYS